MILNNPYNYMYFIKPLTLSEGDGYSIQYPFFPGCMSDGETLEETRLNGKDAVKCWIEAAKKCGRIK